MFIVNINNTHNTICNVNNQSISDTLHVMVLKSYPHSLYHTFFIVLFDVKWLVICMWVDDQHPIIILTYITLYNLCCL